MSLAVGASASEISHVIHLLDDGIDGIDGIDGMKNGIVIAPIAYVLTLKGSPAKSRK